MRGNKIDNLSKIKKAVVVADVVVEKEQTLSTTLSMQITKIVLNADRFFPFLNCFHKIYRLTKDARNLHKKLQSTFTIKLAIMACKQRAFPINFNQTATKNKCFKNA